jgi:hypothetical protein
MGSKIVTANYGTLEFETIWSKANVGSIGKLVNGGYVHLGGVPIKQLREITDIMDSGPDKDAAVEWYKNRGKIPEKPTKKIVLNPDGTFNFDDGSEIMNMSDIINNVPPGALQDAIITWFVSLKKKSEEESIKEAQRIKRVTKKILKEAELGEQDEIVPDMAE